MAKEDHSYRHPTKFGISSRLLVPAPLRDTKDEDAAAELALQRTAAQLEKMRQGRRSEEDGPPDPLGEERERLYRLYARQSANSLKEELKSRQLPTKGRKPDLARRLAVHDLQTRYSMDATVDDDVPMNDPPAVTDEDVLRQQVSLPFAGLPSLSPAALQTLNGAGVVRASPIQAAAIPEIAASTESLILHAQTGSGKTLAYLLPITERMWKDDEEDYRVLILTPTRELAVQVAGIATQLAPRRSVRLISHPSNLAVCNVVKERGELLEQGGRNDDAEQASGPQLFVASAKTILHSLYGDGGNKLPTSPTPKPLAVDFLRSVRYLVLDEVDRLLQAKKSRTDRLNQRHERPAAVVTAAVMRQTLGKVQMVAASATVGRPLRREVSRVLGLLPSECPRVIRGGGGQVQQQKRAVTIPSAVKHYVVHVKDATTGKLLTASFGLIQELQGRILLVLTRGFDMSTRNVIGALHHFGCTSAVSLLDALDGGGGTDHLMERHRQVAAAAGGEILVTGEDSIRGLDLHQLDVVICLGRPNGPDEYTHIAGRTGRAGNAGSIVTVVGQEQAAALTSWERMLNCEFTTIRKPQQVQE